MRRHDVEHGEGGNDLVPVERHAMTTAPATVVADDVEARKAQGPHQSDLVARHRAKAVVRTIRL